MIAGVGLPLPLIVVGALAQHLFVHYGNAQHLVEEVDHLLRPR
jgi:hypothetical protein